MSLADKELPSTVPSFVFVEFTWRVKLIKENRFYVYLHKRKDNGVVFYVGKGSGDRLKRTRKYKSWQNIHTEAGGFTYEIYRDNLTEQEALELESSLISNPEDDWLLVNAIVKFRTNSTTIDDVSRLVHYDETSPTCLRYSCWNNSKIKKTARFAGDVAGYVTNINNPPMYYTVRICGKPTLVHRIVWIIHFGKIPDGMVINHKNNNSLDNRIENLELVTQAVNSRRTLKSNKEGTGVYFTTINGCELFIFTIAVNGKRESKAFSTEKYGKYNALLLATNLRRIRLFQLKHLGYESDDTQETITKLKTEYDVLYKTGNTKVSLNLNIGYHKQGGYTNLVCRWSYHNSRYTKYLSYSGNLHEVLDQMLAFANTKKTEFENMGFDVTIVNNVKVEAIP